MNVDKIAFTKNAKEKNFHKSSLNQYISNPENFNEDNRKLLCYYDADIMLTFN